MGASRLQSVSGRPPSLTRTGVMQGAGEETHDEEPHHGPSRGAAARLHRGPSRVPTEATECPKEAGEG